MPNLFGLDLEKALILKEERLSALDRELSDPKVFSDSRRMKQLGGERAAVEKAVRTIRSLLDTISELEGARELLESEEDTGIKALAEEEIDALEEKKAVLERRTRMLFLPSDPRDEKDVIMEIRAGTGGEEAALFAADLFRMYSRYAEAESWRMETISSNYTGLGGLKEAVFSIHGERVFSRMKFEAGVHRVQRVPRTEASGRIHTSAATVAVLPEADEVDVSIDPNDLRIDVFRSSGPGGQHVNMTDSAVRITHNPSGIVVSCQDEKSQHKNRLKAMRVLRARLKEKMEEEAGRRRAAERRDMVGSGDRSDKIRTYNFKENRVTDHRIGLTLYNLDEIMEGGIGPLLDALVAADEEKRLRKEAG